MGSLNWLKHYLMPAHWTPSSVAGSSVSEPLPLKLSFHYNASRGFYKVVSLMLAMLCDLVALVRGRRPVKPEHSSPQSLT